MVDVSAAAQRFLEDRPTATLGTLRKDGSPQASVVWYLWEDGEFIISTIHTTAKWHNLKRDPRSSVVVEDPETGESGWMLTGGIAGGMTAWSLDRWPEYYRTRLDIAASDAPPISNVLARI